MGLNNGQLGLRLWHQSWNLLRFGDGCLRENLFHRFLFNGLSDSDSAVLFVGSKVRLLVFVAILRWLRVRGAEATTHLDIGPSCEEVSGYCNGIVVVVGTRQRWMLLHGFVGF